MTETQVDTRFVVTSRDSLDSKDYTNAVVCRDADEAAELLAQARVARPFQHHSVRPFGEPVDIPDDNPEE